MVHSSESPEATTSRSSDQPAAELSISVRRYDLPTGPFYIATSHDLRGATGTGHTLREAVGEFTACLPDLWSVMSDDVRSGKPPTEQFKAYERLLTNGDREFEEPSDAVSMNQPSLSKEKEALSQSSEGAL
ncbi:hypothetical protein [Hyphomicrobium sp. ghe19]|uniref:hypothetical protein n=1 Tax=Hyphomicrobium sp. ghe19 TaxID=2682968 RepID=UPI00136694D5|nr:hypothetical protein HYPP_01480 [Hyphomicrobium sp. ghe19]